MKKDQESILTGSRFTLTNNLVLRNEFEINSGVSKIKSNHLTETLQHRPRSKVKYQLFLSKISIISGHENFGCRGRTQNCQFDKKGFRARVICYRRCIHRNRWF